MYKRTMIGPGLRYILSHPARTFSTFAADPLETWTLVRERLASRRERPVPGDLYQPDENWEFRLHNLLGVPWPCPAALEFQALWPQVIEELKAKGISVGPESFLKWNDGDAGLVRAIWCLTRHLRPRNIVETGVAHGVTSRFILEALERNGLGHLWSIDRPPLKSRVARSNRYCS